MKIETITRAAAVEVINRTRGKFFTVKFVKKDGSVRVMNARVNTKKGVNGSGMSYDPAPKALKPIYDVKKGAWRMINLNTIFEVKCNGNIYLVY
jgi:hypothetical protein